MIVDAVFVVTLALFPPNGGSVWISDSYSTRHECLAERAMLIEDAQKFASRNPGAKIFVSECEALKLDEVPTKAE